ncbi:MAG: hypothetical protein WBM14_16360, partial [Terracidiphilus sp.]
HESSIEWHVTQEPHHAGVQHWVKDLNHLYQSQAALHERDFSPDGFQWIGLMYLRDSANNNSPIN